MGAILAAYKASVKKKGKTPEELFQEHLDRIDKAIKEEKKKGEM